jgi:outer membrane protein assembly factor BamE (lipoprotein component of BamABCDE complex)
MIKMPKITLAVLSVLIVVGCSSKKNAADKAARRARALNADNWSEIHIGTTKDEVKMLIGPPENIGHYNGPGPCERWNYIEGGNPIMMQPTSYAYFVTFDPDGMVIDFRGPKSKDSIDIQKSTDKNTNSGQKDTAKKDGEPKPK